MKAYIFDLDGTLLDSMSVWERIDADYLSRRGIEVPPDYIDAVSSLTFSEAARYTIERFRLSESVDSLIDEWNNMAISAYGNTVALKAHAKEYLLSLKKQGAKLGIATSLPPLLYEPALRNHGIMELFDAISSTDEVSRGKTSPDVFLLTAKKLGVEPERCIVFEDIPEAIKSAKLAGMTVYGVYDDASKQHWAAIEKIADGVIYDFKSNSVSSIF
ncbi:MAG: HAD family phosphatase [Clostridiales bacterium]|mgnify:CR=1 FL=1|nr:HAD family phosphatase [Clostridiales bacterium]